MSRPRFLAVAARLEELDLATLAAAVSLLPLDRLTAIRVGSEIALLRADTTEADLIAADYAGGAYHRQHPLTSALAVDVHRYPPNGDRAEWIAYGPAGREPDLLDEPTPVDDDLPVPAARAFGRYLGKTVPVHVIDPGDVPAHLTNGVPA